MKQKIDMMEKNSDSIATFAKYDFFRHYICLLALRWNPRNQTINPNCFVMSSKLSIGSGILGRLR